MKISFISNVLDMASKPKLIILKMVKDK